MRFVEIDELEVGMQPAEDIYDDEDNVLLLDSSKKLDASYIEGLKNMGVLGIYIEDNLSRDIVVKNAISTRQRKKTVESLKKMDIDAGMDEAKDIVSGIVHNDDISLNMKDMRSFDDYTFFHSVNVAVLATIIGKEFGLNSRDLVRLCISGLFHDLGKTRLDINVLNKPGRLDQEEFAQIKKHVRYSYDILKARTDIDESVREGALYHHENYDGTGYPEGLKGDKIPLFARILRVADVYDSLISKRPYKEPFPVNETIEYLLGGCGTLFDEKVVIAFLRSVPIYPKGQKVKLTDGREGFIIANNHENVLRPTVRLFTGEDIDLTDPKYLTIAISVTMEGVPDFSDELQRRRQWKQKDRAYKLMVCDTSDSEYMMLEENYEVQYVKTSKEMVTTLVKGGYMPDLLVFHVNDEGQEVPFLQKLARIYPSLKCVYVFDKYDMQLILSLGRTNGVDYLIKPLHPLVTQEKLEKTLDRLYNKDEK